MNQIAVGTFLFDRIVGYQIIIGYFTALRYCFEQFFP